MQLCEFLQIPFASIKSLQRNPKTGDYLVNIRDSKVSLNVLSEEIVKHELIWKSYELRPLGK
jgi:hypothetical protein